MVGIRFAGARSLMGHMRSAHSENPKARTKQKELAVHTLLTEAGVQFEYQLHMPFASCELASETKCAYVDFAIATEWGYVLLEVDEEQHRGKDKDPSCDVRRDFDIAASTALGSGQPLVVLRYNPDAFKVNGATRTVSSKERQAKLLETLSALEEPREFRRLFMYYDRDADDDVLPLVAKEWDETARRFSHVVC